MTNLRVVALIAGNHTQLYAQRASTGAQSVQRHTGFDFRSCVLTIPFYHASSPFADSARRDRGYRSEAGSADRTADAGRGGGTAHAFAVASARDQGAPDGRAGRARAGCGHAGRVGLPSRLHLHLRKVPQLFCTLRS